MRVPSRRRHRGHPAHRTLQFLPAAALWLCTACGAPTSAGDDASHETAAHDVAAHRSQWNARALGDYSYDYLVTGYFIIWVNRPVHVVVRAGAVQSAAYVDTGTPIPDAARLFPTIEGLFDRVRGAAEAGLLRSVRYDPLFGFPTFFDVDGPPDASGTTRATNFQPAG